MTAIDAIAEGTEPRAVVVVEGESDEVAIEALAERRSVDLATLGVRVERLGGAHRIGKFLERFGVREDGVRLAGLSDAARNRSSAGHWSAPVSAPGSRVRTWSGSASSCASPIWRRS